MRDGHYKLVYGDDNAHPIVDAVNRAIREGWEPLGGVVFLRYRDGVANFAQTMQRSPALCMAQQENRS